MLRPTSIRFAPLPLALAAAWPAFAQQSPAPLVNDLPEVRLTAKPAERETRTTPTSDAARLFEDIPGYSTAAGGGVSGLPILNGFNDDRLKIRVDGMDLTAACGNHMNAPLSYADPKLLGAIKLYAGVTPVALGGDSIGGTIDVKSPPPAFAEDGKALRTEGRASLTARSIDRSWSAGVEASVANDSLAVGYQGAHARGASYKDADGNKVLGSMFESQNDALSLAARGNGNQLVLRMGQQRIPYQGFPNQYMDMTGNHAQFANLNYEGTFGWGKLEARAYWQDVKHEMGFFSPERPGAMPMNTHGRSIGYAVKGEINLGSESLLRLGNEYHRYRLDDWWPALAGSMMMGPHTYQNITGGTRNRFVLYGEWEGRLAEKWTGNFGVRSETVSMDTGGVQPYDTGMMSAADAAAATAFNARGHAKRDNNLDLTAIARYEASNTLGLGFGLARKTRSPNLYERYTWGRGTMSMTMTNWFGDGNGYVGNIDLKPEVANTLSMSVDWHAEDRADWNLTFAPYYSYVSNYIDVDVVGSFNPYGIAGVNGRLLQFANHDAQLYGANLSGAASLARAPAYGELRLRGSLSYNRGKRTDGGDLYRIMPLNATLALDQIKGQWTNTLETRLVSRKNSVDSNRLEMVTPGYTLVNLRTRYQWSTRTAITAGVSNLFNKSYVDPLGGVYLSGLQAANQGPLVMLPGYGRSVDVGVTVAF